MERKNMVLLTVIAVATLLVAVVGATFAYFTAQVTESRTDKDGGTGQTNLTTATVANTTTVGNISGQPGKFSGSDVYPGYTNFAALSVTVAGSDGKYAVPFVYDVTTNTIGEDVTYYLYKASEEYADLSMGCVVDVDTQSESGKTRYSEKCDFRNPNTESWNGQTPLHPTSGGDEATPINELTLIATGKVAKTSGQKVSYQMIDEIEISESAGEEEQFYYFVIEYKNNGEQNTAGDTDQSGKQLDGTISILGAQPGE